MDRLAKVGIFFCFINACTSTKKSAELKVNQDIYQDFCQLHQPYSSVNDSGLWSAESLQHHLRKLIAQAELVGTPWVAYPLVYVKMTAARDGARCSGVLRAENPFHARVNDLLSDVMSRFYIAEVEQCAKSGARLGREHGFCPLMARMQREKFDALSAAMATTGLYISSHIALSLSAVIFADDFWQASPFSETHFKSSNWDEVVRARIERIRSYKPLFDSFNSFLADNIQTVAGALHEAHLLNGHVLDFMSGVSRFVPFKSLLFGKIRDEAFALALTLSLEMQPADHPMIKVRSGRHSIDYGAPDFSFTYPAKLAKLEEDGIGFAANPANMLIYRQVLGGKSWEEVTADHSRQQLP